MSAADGESPFSEEEAHRRFVELYRDFYPKVLGYARRRTSSPEDADEIVSATFVVAWRRIDAYLGADAPLAWLYGVAYRTLLSHQRNEATSARLATKAAREYTPSVNVAEATAEAREQLAGVTAALARLSPVDQELLLLAGWEEQTHSELAAALDIPRPLLRTRLYRARRRLQRQYDRDQGTPETGQV
ncbi:MAG: sigma-70 family RNA polymerase sigma factor [Acidimicrobiia bacterium]|nr:sigma-70 family RNA polymerase sigma factor [Acidimicrobiia bacterium]MDX2466390.1 sigma-70 family RNA polymerase sigma factor [Acidimicrobiia bacterium]